MKFDLLKKEKEFVNRVKENELKQRFPNLKLKLDSRKKSLDHYIQESGSKSSAKPAEVVKDGRKRCFNSAIFDADQWMKEDRSGSNQDKIFLYGEASNGQLKLHPEKSGKLSNPMTQIQNDLKARESEVVAKHAQGIRIEGNKSGSGDGTSGEVFTMDSQRRDGRQCLREGLTEHIKAPPHPPNSGSNEEAETGPNVVIVEDSVDSFALKLTGQPSPFSCGTEQVNQERKFNVGDIWSSFDSKDALPRSQALVISINKKDGKYLLKVKRLKPCPVYDGEKEWIDAGLPVSCGKFNCSGESIISPSILCHPVSCVGESPWIILPCEGETWAIYKDWGISTWSSNPKIHQNCKYDIVEILSYHQDGSSLGVKVAYLNKVEGSSNTYKRRSNDLYSILMRTSLYRFSHRVASIKTDCIDANSTLHSLFELDPRSLPKELL